MKINCVGKAPIIIKHLGTIIDVQSTFHPINIQFIDFNSAHKSALDFARDLYNKGARKFVFDCSFEGPALQKEDGSSAPLDLYFQEFFNSCAESKVLFVTQNLNGIDFFNDKYSKYNGSRSVCYNFIIYSYKNRMDFLKSAGDRKKFIDRLGLYDDSKSKILSLNNIAKPHRLVLYSLLNEYFRDDLDFVSFLARNLSVDILESALTLLPDEEMIIRRQFQNLLDFGPKYTKFEKDGVNPRQEGSFPTQLFSNTLLSLVTESEFTSGSVRRVTEKSLKALACGHELLMVGNPGTISYLEQMGFEISSAIFDNSYDSIVCPKGRIKSISENVKAIAELDVGELNRRVKSRTEDKIHNIDNFLGSFRDFSECMKSELIFEMNELMEN
ncbi:hypothetical protein DXV75_06125 [Alteromonas aestuariivivens]|uniref:Uncharacterized protein n=1 Tax=Alteromonas aestuariivivens TaxID=1938339 RepID=A0A3D8M9C1_9ALTE|nr:hypothetical protein [Alteromonas aestuariivivens]RDV26569.1 hypothetical protein DXV75_06125 [Alteromonas aestuariivivens]